VCDGRTLTGVVSFAGTTVGFCPNCGAGVVIGVRAAPCHAEPGEDYSARYESELLDSKAAACWDIVRRETRGQLAGRRLLDIGCGRGAFLDVARLGGLSTAGVEISERAADAAEAKGHQVFRRSAEEPFGGPDERFDLITMWDIMEHLARPRLALQHAFGRLAEGGRLFILTPMMDSLYDRWGRRVHRLTGGRCDQLLRMCWDQNHLFRFAREGTRRVLLSVGFTKVIAEPVLLLSLRADSYAGGQLLPHWTGVRSFDRLLSRTGVRLAKLFGLNNKLLIVAERAGGGGWRSMTS
jgi:2-polyprenyl-3-methyl-5-hydroxy-6-metoxy-1,4-benzoquinol methylase